MRQQLTITIGDDGKMSLTGPIDNALLCYGMLEAAKFAVKEFADARGKSPIIPATNGVPPDMLAARRG